MPAPDKLKPIVGLAVDRSDHRTVHLAIAARGSTCPVPTPTLTEMIIRVVDGPGQMSLAGICRRRSGRHAAIRRGPLEEDERVCAHRRPSYLNEPAPLAPPGTVPKTPGPEQSTPPKATAVRPSRSRPRPGSWCLMPRQMKTCRRPDAHPHRAPTAARSQAASLPGRCALRSRTGWETP